MGFDISHFFVDLTHDFLYTVIIYCIHIIFLYTYIVFAPLKYTKVNPFINVGVLE